MNKKLFFVLSVFLAIFPVVSFAFTITDDASGGDCSSIGTWDVSTKTCTLTSDLSEIVEIISDNITLDGNGHSVSTTSPSGAGIGVKAVERGNINIRNLTLSGWVQGIVLDFSTGALVENNTLRNNATALQAGYTAYSPADSNRIIRNNVFESNRYAVYLLAAQGDLVEGNTITTDGDPNSIGIYLSANNSIPIVVQNNTVTGPGYAGMFSSDADFNDFLGNTVEGFTYGFYSTYCSSPKNVNGNTFRDNSVGIHIEGASISQAIHNNFVGNGKHLETAFLPFGCGRGIVYELSQPLPEGGNYWDTYDTDAEGCTDGNGDGICDDPYLAGTTTDGFGQGIVDIFDDLPWTTENGWESSLPPQLDVWYVEVNQAVQRIEPDLLTNEVPLVAGKDTIVRAYVRNQDTDHPNPSDVTGALYKSPPGQNLWSQIGMLDSPFITAVADDPTTPGVEPTPEMLGNTLNFRLPGGLQEGNYDLKIEVRVGSNPTVVAEKTTAVTFYKRKTFKILYTKVNYNGDLPPADFADAYLLLQGVYPIPFYPNQWIADDSSLTYTTRVLQTVGCGFRGGSLLRQLGGRMVTYNQSQPPEGKVDYIVGIVASSRLATNRSGDTITGCTNRKTAAFVTDDANEIKVAVAHEIGHIYDLPIPERRPEESGTATDALGYLIDEGFKVPTERKHFIKFSDQFYSITKNHHLFYNFMGLAGEQTSGCCNGVDELTYNFLFQRLSP